MLQRLGRYEVLETLAGGGQGTVYLGREDGSDEVVAIKVMHPGHTGEALYLDALRREANLATRLEHPNVTQIQDFQIEDGVVQKIIHDLLNHRPIACGSIGYLAKQAIRSSGRFLPNQHVFLVEVSFFQGQKPPEGLVIEITKQI